MVTFFGCIHEAPLTLHLWKDSLCYFNQQFSNINNLQFPAYVFLPKNIYPAVPIIQTAIIEYIKTWSPNKCLKCCLYAHYFQNSIGNRMKAHVYLKSLHSWCKYTLYVYFMWAQIHPEAFTIYIDFGFVFFMILSRMISWVRDKSLCTLEIDKLSTVTVFFI